MARRSRSRRAAPEQWDLFGERPHDLASSPAPVPEVALDRLGDRDIVRLVPKANLSNVQGLCDQVMARDLEDSAVPALKALWTRFKGFGRTGPLPEQRGSLETLAQLGTPLSREAVRRIVCAPDLPDALLPLALQAAITAKLALPLRQILPWLDHRAPEVRTLAFALVRAANPPENVLEPGLSDPYLSVRRAALITLGTLGYDRAKPGLLAELDRNPTSQVVLALIAIVDADIMTRLGRCAARYETLRALILEELKGLDDPRAHRVALQVGPWK